MRRAGLLACSALFSIGLVIQPALADSETFTAPQMPAAAAKFTTDTSHIHLTKAQIIALVHAHIKYVFVIYQENRSFDSYFGTYPGADGLYSQRPDKTPGFYQPIENTDGTSTTISPFLIGPSQYAWDTDDADHSHAGLVAAEHVVNRKPQMDGYAKYEEQKYSGTGTPSQEAKGFGELVMAHEDCNTIPFLWGYADKFVLFDHMFQDITGPSTPGNLSIFAAQTGQTQVARHPSEAYTNTTAYGTSGQGEPVLNDNNPYNGSGIDPMGSTNVPRNPGDSTTSFIQLNQTYATLAVNLAGRNLQAITNEDESPQQDLADIQSDIPFVTKSGKADIPWGWYEEGYDKEVTDAAGGTDVNGTHASYITHHNGPQYFGYIANNPIERANLHGVGDFFTAVSTNALPTRGGVFYVKGGYDNTMSLTPDNPVAAAQKNFIGDDDHPGYSDSQISEALVASAVNTIAQSKYWPESAIIITWDDSEGYYDHVPPPTLRDDLASQVSSLGPRVPMILISPYAKIHQIDTEQASQSSVVKFIDEVFGLDPLATLPDERKAERLAKTELGLKNYGPLDASDELGDLMSAFDPARLVGAAATLPPSYVMISPAAITTLPQYGGNGCSTLGIVPEDFLKGIQNNIPSDFNPLPKTNPST